MKLKWNITIALLLFMTLGSVSLFAQQPNDEELLRVRETVWRAWFAGDTKTVAQLVPSDTIVISASESEWKTQADVLKEADEFHATGGKLTRLEFPRTEIQHFGDVAVIWSKFVLETEVNAQRKLSSGRATEIFVRRDGHWVNPGWHTDSVQ
jgi:ketosteroid isomerase-like protein